MLNRSNVGVLCLLSLPLASLLNGAEEQSSTKPRWYVFPVEAQQDTVHGWLPNPFEQLPEDVIIDQILPHLSYAEIKVLRLISKIVGRIIKSAIMQRPQLRSLLLTKYWEQPFVPRKIEEKRPILRVAISPNGNMLASGTDDHVICLRDIKTGKLIKELSGHTKGVTSVAFSLNSELLASGSLDKTIRLWNVKTGECTELTGHTAAVESVAFSPVSSILATGSYDKSICLWNVESGALIDKKEGLPEGVWEVSFSPDGRMLAFRSNDKAIRVWNIETNEIKELTSYTKYYNEFRKADDVRSIAYCPDGEILATGHLCKICIWNVAAGKIIKKLMLKYVDEVHSIAFSRNNKILATGHHGKIFLWNVATGTVLKELNDHWHFVTSLAFSPNSGLLVSGSHDSTIDLWSAKE